MQVSMQSPLSAHSLEPQPRALTAPARSINNAPDFGPAYAVALSGEKAASADGKTPSGNEANAADKTKKADGSECQTCKNRKYQDGSNEANVSFKTPGHIAPENSASVVAAHEREHVNNALHEDKEKGKKLLSSSVRTYTAVCPECGRTYTAGGETRTVMRTTVEHKPYEQDILGKNIDLAA